MNKPYFCRNFFLTDWRHKRLKNTIDLLLFYRENFYGFSESDIATDNFPKINTVYQWIWFDFHLFYFPDMWKVILMTVTGYQAKMLKKKNIWIKFWYIFNKLSSFLVIICQFINQGESRSGRNHIV